MEKSRKILEEFKTDEGTISKITNNLIVIKRIKYINVIDNHSTCHFFTISRIYYLYI